MTSGAYKEKALEAEKPTLGLKFGFLFDSFPFGTGERKPSGM